MIGVAVSTHRRPHVLKRALEAWSQVMPDVLVVNHDTNGEGVAATKNRGLAALMRAGCEHLFLVDDDTWPVTPEWPNLYVGDSEPHLMHCWGHHRLLSDDGHHTRWSHPRGVMLYVERRVVEKIGGMRTEFGRWGGEHAEWSMRIYNAGFTTERYQDLTHARHGVWFSTDYKRTEPSTVGEAERAATKPLRSAMYAKFAGSADFVPYEDS